MAAATGLWRLAPALVVLLALAAAAPALAGAARSGGDISAAPVLVPVTLYVMSRCYDARRCEWRFNSVFERVHSIVDPKTVYIADSKAPIVGCRHGPMECAGDAQQLCTQLYRPAGGDKFGNASFWDFIMCQNKNQSLVGSVEQADACLDKIGVPAPAAAKIKTCYSGWMGQGLLRKSGTSAAKAGVTTSCTVYIADEYRCTHDNGTWYDCPGGSGVDDFVTTICSEYWQLTGVWPDVCGAQAPPAAPSQRRRWL